jgi:DNA-binding MltR family transcriptional regulator
MSEKIPSLSALSREMPTGDEMADLIHGIERLDARAAALILSAFVDNLLEKAIVLNFVPLGTAHFDGIFRKSGAPLSDFSGKIAIAFALGILDAEHRSQADRIRSIRNAFAHTVKPIDFHNPTIKAACDKLDPQRLMTDARYQPDKDTAQEKFTISATLIARRLMRYMRAKADLPELAHPGPASSPDKS